MYEYFACGAVRKRILDNLTAAIAWESDRTGLPKLEEPEDRDDDILEAFNPSDNREGPTIEIYDEGTQITDNRNRIAVVDVTVAIKKTHDDQDLQANQKWMQRYAAIIRRCFEVGPHTLSFVDAWATDPVKILAVVTDGGRDYPFVDTSKTRDIRVVGLEVTVFDQGN